MANYKYSSDLSDGNLARLEMFGVACGCDPIVAAKVWMSESGLYTYAWNHNGGASGILQIMPDILKNLGYRPDIQDNDARSAAFRAEDFSTQVQWATRYYRPYKGKLKNVAMFYVATFLPADLDYALAGDDSTVLVQKDGRRGWAYSANSGFDENHDLKITVGELTDAVNRACNSARWNEINERLSIILKEPVTTVVTADYDLGTIKGVQQALNLLGYVVGDIDGVIGPIFRAAIMQFQKNNALTVDGIFGPNTRKALQTALDNKLKSG